MRGVSMAITLVNPDGLPKVDLYLSVAAALAEVGGSFDDVARLTVYLVDWMPEKMPVVMEGIARAAEKLGVTPVALLTGLGVSALATPDILVVVEATAVID
jgi:enamine deaminase RidA (YjgF/YER057c/UK114 family)